MVAVFYLLAGIITWFLVRNDADFYGSKGAKFFCMVTTVLIWPIYIVSGLYKVIARPSDPQQNLEIAEETRQIVVNEFGIPLDYYNKTILDKNKWKYVREYAGYLKNNSNNAEAVLLKADIKDIDISECSWPRLLAFGIEDLYKTEKPYADMTERLLAGFQK